MNLNIRNGGFSLIELLVAILAFSVLILAVGAMMIFSWHAWRDNSERVAMDRDATISMYTLDKEIRRSSLDEISFDSDGIYFAASSDVGRGSMVAITKDDIATSSGVLLKSWDTPVFDDTTIAGSTGVVVRFVLKTSRTAEQKKYETIAYPRN